MNYIIKEILVWIITILIAIVLWYPVFSKVPYVDTYIGIFQIVLFLNLFRWFVFYPEIIFFKKGWYKLLFILVLGVMIFIFYAKGLNSLRIFENQNLEDITKTGKVFKMSMQEEYDFFQYLRGLTLFCTFATLGAGIGLILKIVYKTIGYGSDKVRKYIGKTTSLS